MLRGWKKCEKRLEKGGGANEGEEVQVWREGNYRKNSGNRAELIRQVKKTKRETEDKENT